MVPIMTVAVAVAIMLPRRGGVLSLLDTRILCGLGEDLGMFSSVPRRFHESIAYILREIRSWKLGYFLCCVACQERTRVCWRGRGALPGRIAHTNPAPSLLMAFHSIHLADLQALVLCGQVV